MSTDPGQQPQPPYPPPAGSVPPSGYGPPPAGPSVPGKRPWYRRKVTTYGATLVAGLIVGGSLAGGGEATDPAPTRAATSTVKVNDSAVRERAADLDKREAELEDREAAVKKAKAEVDRAVSAQEASSFDGEGTYRVGPDIKPGTYRSVKNENCYWARMRGTGGLEDIIANNIGDGPALLTARKGEIVQVRGCNKFRKV